MGDRVNGTRSCVFFFTGRDVGGRYRISRQSRFDQNRFGILQGCIQNFLWYPFRRRKAADPSGAVGMRAVRCAERDFIERTPLVRHDPAAADFTAVVFKLLARFAYPVVKMIDVHDIAIRSSVRKPPGFLTDEGYGFLKDGWGFHEINDGLL